MHNFFKYNLSPIYLLLGYTNTLKCYQTARVHAFEVTADKKKTVLPHITNCISVLFYEYVQNIHMSTLKQHQHERAKDITDNVNSQNT